MEIEVLDNADMVAQKAASIIAGEARKAVALRGRFIIAVSGGKTPWKMLRALADEDVPWEGMHILQVDERLAPEGHPDRNMTHLRESLSGMFLCFRAASMPCRLKRKTLKQQLPAMHGLSGRSPGHRQ